MILSVSTVKDTVPNLEKFVRRNLAGGIDHLLVFLDDQQPEAAQLLEAHPHVTCVRTHRGWWHGQRPKGLNERQGRNAALSARVLSEFDWADFLRTRIPSQTVAMDFDSALDHAKSLARTPAAQHLPGWLAGSDTRPSLSASIASPYVGQ